eukprot:CAMPEP_0197070574 /NCGR_PEP_ID=MMETSP1384-20130603/201089_1 /TAXON_ID=29189 /ORGANISM="Ammonia sp." /LENGTH=86 /DNA_ID=CAMNT_0042509007 /DNA_START=77 /DNA_END=333 /DNA_ORIENTATION=+
MEDEEFSTKGTKHDDHEEEHASNESTNHGQTELIVMNQSISEIPRSEELAEQELNESHDHMLHSEDDEDEDEMEASPQSSYLDALA